MESVVASGAVAAARILDWLGRRIESTRSGWLVAVVVAITVAKAGLNVTYIWDPALTTPAFPQPVGLNDGTSLGLPALMWVLQIHSHGPMLIVAFLLTMAVIVGFSAAALHRFGRISGVAVAGAVMWGPTGLVLLSQIGRHDVLTIGGGLLVAFGAPRLLPVVTGAVIMVAGNPEQSVVAVVAFLLLVVGLRDRGRTRAALSAFAVVAAGYVATTLLARHYGLQTRTSLFREMFGESMTNFARNAPLVLYATFGLALVALLLILLGVGARRWWLVAAAMALPFLAGILTADQTRVGVCVGVPVSVTALMLAGRGLSLSASGGRGQRRLVGAALIALVLPPVEIVYPGRVYSPYEYLVTLVQRRL